MYNRGDGTIFKKNKIKESLIKLEEIKNLKKNWNGYGANEFSLELINKCEEIVKIFIYNQKFFQLEIIVFNLNMN